VCLASRDGPRWRSLWAAKGRMTLPAAIGHSQRVLCHHRLHLDEGLPNNVDITQIAGEAPSFSRAVAASALPDGVALSCSPRAG